MDLRGPRKISIHIPMTARQIRILSREARRQEISLQELVRRLADNYIDAREPTESVDFRA